MKKEKILFWVTTSIIALFEGVMPALTSQSDLAKEGIRHLGYPEYFGTALVVFKILGVLALIIPQVPKRIKEWAYAGFTFNFIFATISHGAVDGLNFQTFFPLIVLSILMVSYRYFHKLTPGQAQKSKNHPAIHIMAEINPYINFNGNAEEAFNFYKSVFGGEFERIVRLKDLSSPEFPIPENDAEKIMYIALPIGKNTLKANDVPESLGPVNENEHRSKIAVSAQSREEADKLFNGLSAGGTIEVSMDNSPWGTYFGMFRDKFGIEWIIEFESK